MKDWCGMAQWFNEPFRVVHGTGPCRAGPGSLFALFTPRVTVYLFEKYWPQFLVGDLSIFP
jgi:hypothetical protein